MAEQKQKTKAPSKLILQGIALAILAIIALGVWYGANYYKTEVESNSNVDAQYSALFSQLKSVESQSSAIAEEIKSSGTSLAGTFMSKDEFVTFAGATVQRMGLQLSKYSGGMTTSENGIDTINFTIEVKGPLPQITEFIAAVDELNTPYAINAMSLRREAEFIWQGRDFDEKALLEWFDEKSIEQKKAYTEIEDDPAIGVSDMISGADMYLYMDISFTTATASQDGGAE